MKTFKCSLCEEKRKGNLAPDAEIICSNCVKLLQVKPDEWKTRLYDRAARRRSKWVAKQIMSFLPEVIRDGIQRPIDRKTIMPST